MSDPTVIERGRAKAYRPLPTATRWAALVAGLAAYDRGDYFLAHELLEPAWMGAADAGERALHSGLIKLAAAGVHASRGNPAGVTKNLVGARQRLTTVGHAAVPEAALLDLPGLIAAIDARLAAQVARPSVDNPPAIPRRPR